ncbi:MAG: hypothetical protein NTV54_01205 [Ignavibacteriales bacterium]|nr:hypothetical protein [Ignavibacteriales bacterium]
MKTLTAICLTICCGAGLWAQTESGTVGHTRIIPWQQAGVIDTMQPGFPKEPPKELQFLALYYTHAVATDLYSQNAFSGEIIGRLFGANKSDVGRNTAIYFEQRLLPFFFYQPKLFNGKVILRTSFEIDWTWGDESYLYGGNRGGAFNADRVNIQTQNVEVELLPYEGWAVNIGMQRLYDTPYNPYRTSVSTLLNTGYRLAYWGSDATGISVRKDWDYMRLKTGFYQLYERDPELDNDVVLWEGMFENDITPLWKQGISFWYVRDRANGQAGVSTINEGLNSELVDWNGAFKFSFPYSNLSDPENKYRADIYWIGTFWSVNPEFTMARWGMSGFVMSNLGTVEYHDQGKWRKTADVFGVAANVRGGYRYGQTADDAITADLLYTTGDDNGTSDKEYSGVMTSNTWGFPGAIFVGTGSYILLPHGNVVNRYIAAIGDISNMGLGTTALVLNASYGAIPNKLSLKAGAAHGISNVNPKGGASTIGTEVNVRAVYNLGVFLSVEFHAAYMWLGDFYDSKLINANRASRPDDPWTSMLIFRWLIF